ncbi:MAG: STN domain-containing protein, partial [Prevotellaceae bacterium]|nr:STN domain-containing protein [Prevotellaceae bacterium]
MNVNNITVKDAIESLKEKRDYSFVFEVGDLNTRKRVSVSATNLPVENVIKQILAGQNVNYRVVGKTIVITKEEQAPVEQVRKVEGIVSSPNGELVIGATVAVKNSSNATMTD